MSENMVMSVNTSGTDYFVYHTDRFRDRVVGMIKPACMDWEFLLSSRKIVSRLRECEIVSGSEEMFCKTGEVVRHCGHDLYVSDYVTMVCNYSCPYCLTDSPELTRQKVEVIPWRERLEWLRSVGGGCAERGLTYYYRIFGGEPTVYPGIEEILSYVNGDPACKVCNLSTNLHLRPKVEFIAGSLDPKKVTVYASVHPADPIFDFANFKVNLRLLYEAGFSIYLIGVNVRINTDLLHKYSEELQEVFGAPISIFHNLRTDKYE